MDEESRELHFEEINLRFPFDTATAWKNNSKTGGFYNLAALCFYSQMKTMGTGAYMKASNAKNINIVDFKDRKPLDSFFTTKSGDFPSNVDQSVWLQSLIPKSNIHGGKVDTTLARKRDAKAGLKGPTTLNPEEKGVAKEERKLEVIDHVLMNEKRIHSRVNILQS